MTNTMPANDTRPAAKYAPVTVWEIRSKDRTIKGRVYPGEVRKGRHAQIVPGVSIRLFGVVSEGAETPYIRDFKIGDEAEYDSYNLSYTGTITAITEKTITIVDGTVTHRLSLCDFEWRNYDFDAAKTAARNADELVCL